MILSSRILVMRCDHTHFAFLQPFIAAQRFVLETWQRDISTPNDCAGDDSQDHKPPKGHLFTTTKWQLVNVNVRNNTIIIK